MQNFIIKSIFKYFYLLFVFFFNYNYSIFNYKLLLYYNFYRNIRKRPIILELEIYGTNLRQGGPAKFI